MQTVPMKRLRTLAMALALLLAGGVLFAHDLFLVPDDFFVRPYSEVDFRLLNGTFERSEGPVVFDRVVSLDVVGPAGSEVVGDAGWESAGDTSRFALAVGAAGTWLAGVSTRPRIIELTGQEFNEYLEHDGIPDELEARRREGRLDEPARERYAKHVKALVQAGDEPTDGHDHVLGYPAELVPLTNPYTLGAGDELAVRALVDGEPVANQLIIAGGRGPDGEALPLQEVRSSRDGVARIALSPGVWYVKFIHMARVQEEEANYESKWATLTFAVR